MKNLIALLTFVFALSLPSQTVAQDQCKVLIPEIADKYEGRCRKGLAHGRGVAKGEDKYEGRFRSGLPHGSGVYTWANGNIYNGKWRNGMRHGKGIYSYYEDEELKVLSGIWRNDEYVGQEREAAYTRGHMLNISRYSIKESRTSEADEVLLNFYYMGRMGQIPQDLVFRMETGFSHREGLLVGYREVEFPASILITYTVPDKLGQGLRIPVRFEVTINKPGAWVISLYN